MRRVFALVVWWMVPAFATTVISITGDINPGMAGAVDYSQALAVAWTQTGTYQSVRIEINAIDNSLGLAPAVSFLTNSIGPGTTAANEIARNDAVWADPFADGPVVLFSDITLYPGLYYLVLAPLLNPDASSDTRLGWNTTASSTVLTAPDVMAGDLVGNLEFYANPDPGLFEGYVPAWNFIAGAGPGGDLLFDVSVPEPGTAWVVLAAGALLLWRRRRQA